MQGFVGSAKASIDSVDAACEQVGSSQHLQGVLRAVLAVGNALNTGTARAQANGVKLDSLMKLADVKVSYNFGHHSSQTPFSLLCGTAAAVVAARDLSRGKLCLGCTVADCCRCIAGFSSAYLPLVCPIRARCRVVSTHTFKLLWLDIYGSVSTQVLALGMDYSSAHIDYRSRGQPQRHRQLPSPALPKTARTHRTRQESAAPAAKQRNLVARCLQSAPCWSLWPGWC